MPILTRSDSLKVQSKYLSLWRATVLGRHYRKLDPRWQEPVISYKFNPLGNEVYPDLVHLDKEKVRSKHLVMVGVGYLNVFKILLSIYAFEDLDPKSSNLPKLIITDPSIQVFKFWELMKRSACSGESFDAFIKNMDLGLRDEIMPLYQVDRTIQEVFSALFKNRDSHTSYPAFREMLIRATLAPYDWSGNAVVNLGCHLINVDKAKTCVLIYTSNVYEFLVKRPEMFVSMNKMHAEDEKYSPSDQMLDNIAALRADIVLHMRTEAHVEKPGNMRPTRALMFSGILAPAVVRDELLSKKYNKMHDSSYPIPSKRPRQSLV